MEVFEIVVALLLARLTLAVNARASDVSTAVVVQFCTTFGLWMLAERLRLSGIITMVVFAMVGATPPGGAAGRRGGIAAGLHRNIRRREALFTQPWRELSAPDPIPTA